MALMRTETQRLTAPAAASRRKRRFRWSDVSAHAPLIIAALVTLFPFFVMLVISVQPG